MAPSAKDWIDARVLDLWEGRRLLVRALPRSGKSWFAERILAGLGETGILAEGRHYSEDNQAALRANIIERLKDCVKQRGSAQLVFDDYHKALSRSQGARLQAQLHAVLVDAPEARDIGAIFFARQITPVHLDVRGSPLVSRLEPAALPEWVDSDLAHYGIREVPDHLESLIGRNLGDLHRYSVGGYSRVEERLKIDAGSIVQDLPADVTEALAGQRQLASLSPAATCQMAGLTCVVGDEIQLSRAAKAADVEGRVRRTGQWPADPKAGSQSFAELLDGCARALWSDRYLAVDPQRLTSFLLLVREHTSCHLDLLMSDRIPNTAINFTDLSQVEASCPAVVIRLMTPADRQQLHDRHLVRLEESGGWAIPTFDVLTGVQPPGSAVATRAAGFGVDYSEIWSRSTPLAQRARLTRHS